MVHIHTIRSQALLLPGVLHWWPSRAGLGQDAARDPAGHQGGNPPSSPALSLVRAPIAVLLTQQCPLSCLNNQPAFRPRTTCITLLSSAPPQSLAQISLKIHWINTWTNTDSPHFHDSLPQSLPPLEPETKLYGNALQTLLYIGVTWFENTDYTNGYCVKLQNRLIRLRKDFFFFFPYQKERKTCFLKESLDSTEQYFQSFEAGPFMGAACSALTPGQGDDQGRDCCVLPSYPETGSV